MIPALVCLPHHIVHGTLCLTVGEDLVGLAVGLVGLARMCVCTFMCVYAHAKPKVKLGTNKMTRIVNGLLIPNNINPSPILVIRPYVNSDRNIRSDSSPKAIHSRLSTTHKLTPMFLLFKLQP